MVTETSSVFYPCSTLSLLRKVQSTQVSSLGGGGGGGFFEKTPLPPVLLWGGGGVLYENITQREEFWMLKCMPFDVTLIRQRIYIFSTNFLSIKACHILYTDTYGCLIGRERVGKVLIGHRLRDREGRRARGGG